LVAATRSLPGVGHGETPRMYNSAASQFELVKMRAISRLCCKNCACRR